MPRHILKCLYLKGGSKRTLAHLENLVNYIATRDGVEKINIENKNLSSTTKQEEIITQIIKEFPSAKNLFEYEDYIQDPTIENASEFISIAIEQNIDKIGKRKNYVDYIANRPRVEKMGKHGLFTGGDNSLVLSRIADEVSNHEGNVWTPVISLRREDAKRLGFDNAERWHNMLSYYAIDIAECLKIKPENFQWYAAFHNEGHYPHIHMICYSTDSKAYEWYKKALTAFHKVEDRKPWKYTEYRIGKMYSQGLGTEEDHEKATYWLTLSAEQRYKFAEYSLGGLYYRGQGVEQSYRKAFDLYLKSAKQSFPYADFEVAKMYRDGIGTDRNKDESERYFRSAFIGFESLEKQSHDDKIQYRLGWMLQNGIGTEKDIEEAKKYFEKSAKLGNVFACYSLAKLILTEENPTGKEIKKAIEYLKQASASGNQFAQYSLGKLYLDGKYIDKDILKAVELFKLSAGEGNEYAAYKLGKLYLKGEDITKDIPLAIVWLHLSAGKENQYAQYLLGKIYLTGEGVPRNKEEAVKWFQLSA